MTRAELRAALRRRLEDTGPSPLWDDATLDDALAGALAAYGGRVPKEAAVEVAVPAGATRVPVAASIDPARIVRVFDGAGAAVPWDEAPAGPADAGAGQAWRWWDGALLLRRPVGAPAAPWRIEFFAARAAPIDDVAAIDVFPGDEGVVLVLAAAAALRRRATEDAKRGHLVPTAPLAVAAEAEAERLLGSRRRRARGGRLG